MGESENRHADLVQRVQVLERQNDELKAELHSEVMATKHRLDNCTAGNAQEHVQQMTQLDERMSQVEAKCENTRQSMAEEVAIDAVMGNLGYEQDEKTRLERCRE